MAYTRKDDTTFLLIIISNSNFFKVRRVNSGTRHGLEHSNKWNISLFRLLIVRDNIYYSVFFTLKHLPGFFYRLGFAWYALDGSKCDFSLW